MFFSSRSRLIFLAREKGPCLKPRSKAMFLVRKAVQSYMRADENMKRGINNVLQAKLPSLLYTDAMPPLRRTQGNYLTFMFT